MNNEPYYIKQGTYTCRSAWGQLREQYEDAIAFGFLGHLIDERGMTLRQAMRWYHDYRRRPDVVARERTMPGFQGVIAMRGKEK